MRYYEMNGQYEISNPLEQVSNKEVKNFYEKENEFEFENEKPPF